jgi:ABC-type Fe3+/spermidine/putrescine transport system ATPase subunit
MRREIKRLHEETGTTALYVTHDQEEALSIADRIAVMREGLLQQVGTPRELYREPVSRFVAEFMGETNILSGTLKGFDGEFATIETAYGPLRVAKPSSISAAENQQVWCSIRPESWRILNDDKAEAAGNRLVARVETVMYQGAVEQYQAVLTGARESAEETGVNAEAQIKVAAVNPGARVAQPGDALTLSCAPEDVVLLSA